MNSSINVEHGLLVHTITMSCLLTFFALVLATCTISESIVCGCFTIALTKYLVRFFQIRTKFLLWQPDTTNILGIRFKREILSFQLTLYSQPVLLFNRFISMTVLKGLPVFSFCSEANCIFQRNEVEYLLNILLLHLSDYQLFS